MGMWHHNYAPNANRMSSVAAIGAGCWYRHSSVRVRMLIAAVV